MDESKGLSYFFLGLGIGVAVGIIFAPAAGSETRGQIRSKAEEGGEFVKRRGEKLKEEASGLVDKSKELLGKQKDQFSSALDAGRQAYRDAVGDVRDAGERIAHDTKEAIQGI
ncbi:MAG: YtxH domain-containing protein [Bryobacteraceae bacterium]|nr:YtxH domain-containing protein [Bryobacteraceae bacterium]